MNPEEFDCHGNLTSYSEICIYSNSKDTSQGYGLPTIMLHLCSVCLHYLEKVYFV